MKTPKYLLLSCLLAPGLRQMAAHAEKIQPDAITNRPIPKSLDASNADEYVLSLSRAAGVNVIMDSTAIPAEKAVIPYPSTPGAIAGVAGADAGKWDRRLINVMGDFAAQETLSTIRPDSNTFLFWREPDPMTLVSLQAHILISKEKSLYPGPDQTQEKPPESPLSKSDLNQMLRAFLNKNIALAKQSNTTPSQITLQIGIADLPPELRSALLQNFEDRFADPLSLELLSDNFWSDPTLQVHARVQDGTTTLEIPYSLKDSNGKEISRNTCALNFKDDGQDGLKLDAEANDVPELLSINYDQASHLKLEELYSGTSDQVPASSWEADQPLQAPVTVDAKRLSLPQFLADLGQKQGVKFAWEGNPPSTNLVTAHVENMPLAKLMSLLTRVYGVQWNKVGEASYRVKPDPLGQDHQSMLSMGDPDRYRFRYQFYTRADREEQASSTGSAIVKKCGLPALEAPEGVVFSDLPAPLQLAFRQSVEEPVAESLSTMLYKFNRWTGAELDKGSLVLRFGPLTRRIYGTPFMGMAVPEYPGMSCFFLETSDGSTSVPVFDDFVVMAPKPGQKAAHPPSRRR